MEFLNIIFSTARIIIMDDVNKTNLLRILTILYKKMFQLIFIFGAIKTIQENAFFIN